MDFLNKGLFVENFTTLEGRCHFSVTSAVTEGGVSTPEVRSHRYISRDLGN